MLKKRKGDVGRKRNLVGMDGGDVGGFGANIG